MRTITQLSKLPLSFLPLVYWNFLWLFLLLESCPHGYASRAKIKPQFWAPGIVTKHPWYKVQPPPAAGRWTLIATHLHSHWAWGGNPALLNYLSPGWPHFKLVLFILTFLLISYYKSNTLSFFFLLKATLILKFCKHCWKRLVHI